MLAGPTCRNATCPEDKLRIRLADAGGLYLEVAPNGSKRWFVKYRFAGKERRLALGGYPHVSLKTAREGRDNARSARRRRDPDPVQARRVEKIASRTASATTFEAVAREFYAIKAGGWSRGYAARWLTFMEQDMFTVLRSLPLADITPQLLLDALRRVEKRGAIETAHKLRQIAGQVFRKCFATGCRLAVASAALPPTCTAPCSPSR